MLLIDLQQLNGQARSEAHLPRLAVVDVALVLAAPAHAVVLVTVAAAEPATEPVTVAVDY